MRFGEVVAVAPGGVEWRLVKAGHEVAARPYLHGQRVHHDAGDGAWYSVGGPCDTRHGLTDLEVLLLWRTGPESGKYVEELSPLYADVPPVLRNLLYANSDESCA